MGGGRWVVVVVTAMAMVMVEVVVVSGEGVRELLCGRECSCKETVRQIEHDYIVTCDASSLDWAMLTGLLLKDRPSFQGASSPRVHVTVKGGTGLTLNITTDFLQEWKQVTTCHLHVAGGGTVVFPTKVPHFKPLNPLDHFYAGVTLTNMTASEVPVGVLSGKQAAALTLNNSTVARLPAGLLQGVTSLYRLHVSNSAVGVVEGPLGGPDLNTRTWLAPETMPVRLVNSTVGLLRGGAIHLETERDQTVLLQGLTLGRVESGALQVEGGGEVLVERNVAARVEADAMLVWKGSNLTLRHNWLTLEPGALTSLPCGEYQNRLYHNHFSLLHNASALPVSLAMPWDLQIESEEQTAEWQRLADLLHTVLHPTCVSHNLPPLPTTAPLLQESTSQAHNLKVKVLIFAGMGVVLGIALTAIFMVLLKRCRSRRRRRSRVEPPHVVCMSQLHEPIYEEPRMTPPDLPPRSATMRRNDAKDTCCSGEVQGANTVENDYMVMKGH